jgi:hypothetical protein
MWRIVIAVAVAIACVIATVDYVSFDRACREAVAASIELGGRPSSIGGWPMGREFVIRFDRPPTDDALRRLAAAGHGSRRISLTLYFACEVSDARLRAMRETVVLHPVKIVVSPEEDVPTEH